MRLRTDHPPHYKYLNQLLHEFFFVEVPIAACVPLLLKLDISLAKAELGWKPAMNAREALELTLQWYKTYYQDKGFISDLTEQQIQYFFSK